MSEHVIADLIEGLDVRPRGGARTLCVSGLSEDSRDISPGMIFLARAGMASDGRDWIEQAVSRGAAVVLSDAHGCGRTRGPSLECEDPAGIGAVLAHRLAGCPSVSVPVVGVTGTNGKSTVTWLLRQVLDRCALMGGIDVDDLGMAERAALTTPAATDIAAWLRRAVDNGARHAVMEVSSHAIDQRRVEGVQLAAAVFTNLSGDHLDYHGSMEAYAATKRRLFEQLDAGATAIVNADDPHGPMMARSAPGLVITCGLDTKADVRGTVTGMCRRGLSMSVETPWGTADLRSGLVGRHNAMNLLQVVATAGALGVSMDTLGPVLAGASPPPGRLEPVPGPAETATVLVDFAHTDGALEAVLRAVRPLVPSGGRLITVFGCGGDRDRSKRPRMGTVAVEHSDEVWITSDNPRTESPEAIIDEIAAGVDAPTCPVHQEIDRGKAIEAAIASSCGDDLLVIAGKGHETTQIIGETHRTFDDRLVAAGALQRRCVPGIEYVPGGVFTDSRACVSGGLFVAIAGDTHDGHDHLEVVCAGGARAAMVRHGTSMPDGLTGVHVDDPRSALGVLAAAWRRQCERLRVVGITGTAGKTTTKNMLAEICGSVLRTVASPRSFNNDIGVPMTMLAAGPDDDVLIAEVGTSSPGEIAPLAAMLQPDLAVVTLVGRGHLEGLGTIEAVAREKYALLEAVSPEGMALIRLQSHAVPDCRCRIRTFGPEPEADHVLEAHGMDDDGAWMQFEGRRWRVGLPGAHGALDALASLLVGRELGIDDDMIGAGLARYAPTSGRFRTHDIGGAQVIDDTWNANPESMSAALEAFELVAGQACGRRILVLGDMLELGRDARLMHVELAAAIARLDRTIGLHRVLFVGEHMEVLADALPASLRAATFERWDQVPQEVDLCQGDCVLVKGSRGVGLDRLVAQWRTGTTSTEHVH